MKEGMKMMIAVLATAMVCIAGTYVLVDNDEGSSGSTLSVVGSTSIQPLMTQYAEEFEKYSDISLNIQPGGSSAGVSNTLNGTADIGMVSRDLKASEASQGLVVTTIGKDAVVMIVNDDVVSILPATGLSLDDLKKIFNGTYTNWNQVPGVTADKKINPVLREEGSGTRDCFESVTGGVPPTNAQWTSLSSTGAVMTQVNNTPGSIGYISMGSVTADVNVTKLSGVEASAETVKNDTYKLYRNLNLITKGEPKGDAAFLLNWILSEQGQDILEAAKFIRI